MFKNQRIERTQTHSANYGIPAQQGSLQTLKQHRMQGKEKWMADQQTLITLPILNEFPLESLINYISKTMVVIGGSRGVRIESSIDLAEHQVGFSDG